MDPSPSNFPTDNNEQFSPNLQERESSPKLQEKSIEQSLLEINVDQSSSEDKHSSSDLPNNSSHDQSYLYRLSPSPSIEGINPIL